jgi:hypothetical protein
MSGMHPPPLELEYHRPSMPVRPTAPLPGERFQIGNYTVEARKCTIDKCPCDGVTRYFLYNMHRRGGIDGKGLLAAGRNWERFCHLRGWYDDPSSVERQPVESASSPAPSSKRDGPVSSASRSSASSSESPRSSSASSTRSSKPRPGPSKPPSNSSGPRSQLGLFGDDHD